GELLGAGGLLGALQRGGVLVGEISPRSLQIPLALREVAVDLTFAFEDLVSLSSDALALVLLLQSPGSFFAQLQGREPEHDREAGCHQESGAEQRAMHTPHGDAAPNQGPQRFAGTQRLSRRGRESIDPARELGKLGRRENAAGRGTELQASLG